MNILIVSFYDDNFGDNLIKICFRRILEVVLKNLKVEKYNILEMPLKKIDEEKIKSSDLICFAGGGLLGLSYLNFFEYLEKIISLADENNIPVIFSSVGINNMDATEENEIKLKELLSNKCIKAISVRENLEFFDKYLDRKDIKVEKVCDPAVWTRYIYHDIPKKVNSNVIGINVVRGGLFNDNGKEWVLADEMNYLNSIKDLLEANGYDYKFYTNGSFLDNNALKFYSQKYNIPEEHVILPDTTREFVQTVSEFSTVIAIRMHSSIVSYSYNIPSITLVWNDKIPFFYEGINKKDNAIMLENWNTEKIFDFIKENDKKEFYDDNVDYLMPLYSNLYNNMKKIFKITNDKIYNFKEVVKELEKNKISIDEDILDYKIKLEKGSNSYLARFKELRTKNKDLRELEEEKKKLNNNCVELENNNKKLQEKINENSIEIEKLTETNKKINDVLKTKEKELKKLNSLFVIKVRKKLGKIKRKLRKKR